LSWFQVNDPFLIIFCFSTGASDSKDVDQTPPSIIKKIGESVDKEIRCSHSIPSYQVILWYKQDKHKALKLLGYQNNDFANLEQDVKGKISFEGDGRKQSILTVSNLTVDDSAVYFCAASQHSAAESHEGAVWLHPECYTEPGL
uniref:Ig-like domain-containing protein n=1 Tax=Poecilia mexicana TaxID=48701 RepID=A0A3B3Z6G9_9TELE